MGQIQPVSIIERFIAPVKVTDQAYVNGQWEYTSSLTDDIGYLSNPSSDIYKSGWWARSNKSIDYTLHLDPGSYTLISGYQEWWGATRNMEFSG